MLELKEKDILRVTKGIVWGIAKGTDWAIIAMRYVFNLHHLLMVRGFTFLRSFIQWRGDEEKVK